MRKKLKPIDKLMAAADAYSIARARADWTHGYRSHLEAVSGRNTSEAERLWEKQQAQWDAVDKAEQRMRRAFLRVLREAGDGHG